MDSVEWSDLVEFPLVLLKPGTGLRNLRAACRLAKVKQVLTAHRFIEQAKLHDLVDERARVVVGRALAVGRGLAVGLRRLAPGLARRHEGALLGRGFAVRRRRGGRRVLPPRAFAACLSANGRAGFP